MNIKIPQYNIEYLPDISKTKFVDIHHEFLSAMQAEITSNFLYEPINDKTIDRIKCYAEQAISRSCGGAVIHNVKIDDMLDLESKVSECRACAETSSYEEYRIKRAAMNLPDEAGSEQEWSRMSHYRPGQVDVHIDFISPSPVQEINCVFKID